MSATSHVENVVLGGGEAGKYIAWELAHPTMAEGLNVLLATVPLDAGASLNS